MLSERISADFDAHVHKWPMVTNQDGEHVGYWVSLEQIRQLRSFVLATHRSSEGGGLRHSSVSAAAHDRVVGADAPASLSDDDCKHSLAGIDEAGYVTCADCGKVLDTP